MTTRFSLSELSEMLQVPVSVVRCAVEALAQTGQLTAESFPFGQGSWRVAPSDVKRLQRWIEDGVQSGKLTIEGPRRRVKSRRRTPTSD